MRTHQAAKRPTPVARVEAKSTERAPFSPRPKQGDAALADRQAQPPVHQFARLSLERASVAAAPPPNRTGLPDRLKAGIEHLSGFAMDDVRVHYNSSKPATVQALAYTKGTEIHVGPGQEKHLPHEAWHVVQQAQGRVKPTLQMKGIAINDNAALEQEADAMARQAIGTSDSASAFGQPREAPRAQLAPATVQRKFTYNETLYDGTGELPAIPGVGEEDIKSLAESKTNYGKLTPEQIKERAARQQQNQQRHQKQQPKQKQKPKHAAGSEKEKRIAPLLALKPHIAGEKDQNTVKGGHLLDLMKQVHGKNSVGHDGKEDTANPWECNWGLLTKDGAKKAQNNRTQADYATWPLKRSSMFPSDWTWKTLEEQLKDHTFVGNKIYLKDGIQIHRAGETFYPATSKE